MKEVFKTVHITEGNYYTIVVGNRIATEKKFNSKEEAEAYRDNVNWDMIFTLICAIVDGVKNEIKEELNKN